MCPEEPGRGGFHFADRQASCGTYWQSEFLQLLWQIGGLAFLLYGGSPQSKGKAAGATPDEDRAYS